MNEDGMIVDLQHRLISKTPARSALSLVSQMIRSGKDADTIVRSILGEDAQISIDAIDGVCFTFARHEIRKLTPVSTCSVD